MQGKRFPVSETIFAAHVAYIDEVIRRETDPKVKAQFRTERQRYMIGDYPSLNYSDASSAFDWIMRGNKPPIPDLDDPSSIQVPRLDGIDRIVSTMQQRAALGFEVTRHEKALAQVLYNPDYEANIAIDKEGAKTMARELTKMACDTAREIYGNQTGLGAIFPKR